jgi:hypothetical protein
LPVLGGHMNQASTYRKIKVTQSTRAGSLLNQVHLIAQVGKRSRSPKSVGATADDNMRSGH